MYAFLVLAALVVTFFVALFAGGALVGLASLGVQALRAIGKTRDVKSEICLATAQTRPARLPYAARAESAAQVDAAYAAA